MVALGLTPGPPTPADASAPPVSTPTYERYCGFSGDDASANCASRTPCQEGYSDVCPDGQSCFNIPQPCLVGGASGGGDIPAEGGAGASGPYPPTPTDFLQETAPPTPKPVVFDPSSPAFCGF